MKNFDFEILDTLDTDENTGNDMFLCESDACSLEDLLRLVELGDDDCIDRSSIHFSCDEDALIWGLSYIMETPLGRSMACDARFDEWAIEVDDLDKQIPQVDVQLRIIILPRGTPSIQTLSQTPHYRAQFLYNLARGLRLIWQNMNNVRTRQDLSIDDQLLWERLRNADLDVIALRMAWDLRDSDDGAMWRYMIAGDLGDVATVSACLWADNDYSEVNETQTGQLAPILLGCFQSWLGCDALLAECDSCTLDYIDERLQKSLQDVCGQALLSPSDVLALGRIPDEGTYLAPLCRTILFAEDVRRIPDPVNEAHMQQIIEDCALLNRPSLVFRDTLLQEKIFPQQGVNTLA